ncbi:tumor necrosis factor ligand superfamily member 9 [Monodelphis domestica]|uniref:tumor necrosis factor ligand superfamily member 9 n=1 Tax=Monodelphis domestica TaxID=13616 RepID=UPI0000F2C75E|nr:tumor necrosis factor ligand superfamily member 9 [Monodelphis domestica]
MGANSDPENPDHLSQAPARTCRALDWFLVTAILLLAGVLAAYAVLGTNSARLPASEGLSAPRPPVQGPYAQLVVKDVLVQNQTLSWYSHPHLSGVFLDSQMTYDTEKDELKVGVSGLYFVYARLKLNQVVVPAYSQGTVKVSVSVGQDFGHRAVLTLSLDVGPSSPFTVTTSETSLLFLYPGDRLRLSMNTTAGDFQDWQLVSEASTFGLFRVAAR